jgi:beta-fructofuranosidase
MTDKIRRTEALIACARELRGKLDHDPQRPRYHFMPPCAWMNDINGALFWQGRYHLCYQYHPDGAYWANMHWGHASSADLVHWVHHPAVLAPTPGGPDREGCFSGVAVVWDDRPTFLYYGVPDGLCLATADDDLLLSWTKHPANPVLPVPRPGDPNHDRYTVYDPCAWQDERGFCALAGARVPGVEGDATSLFRSPDLVHWEYVNQFYQSDRRWTDADEDCAVPDFFPLGASHMLLFGSHLCSTQYYLGRLEGDRFHPEVHGRMAWAGGHLGGAQTLLDGQGRRIFFDWIRELRGAEAERASGWSGVMTLPRHLSLGADGTLRMEPVPELQALRLNQRRREALALSPDTDLVLDDVTGDCLELGLTAQLDEGACLGLKVRCSPDGAEQTSIVCDPAAQCLRVDVSQSTLDPTLHYNYYRSEAALDRLPPEKRTVSAQEAPFALAPGEPLRLRVFLDRSVLEVFANGRQCLTQRIYPTRPDSLRVALFARGAGVRVSLLEAWDMAPAGL